MLKVENSPYQVSFKVLQLFDLIKQRAIVMSGSFGCIQKLFQCLLHFVSFPFAIRLGNVFPTVYHLVGMVSHGGILFCEHILGSIILRLLLIKRKP